MISTGLDQFVATLKTSTGMDVTRDPDRIFPPCLFVDIPTVTGRTMGAVTLEVNVHLIMPGPGNQVAADALCDRIELVLDACGANTATPAPFSDSLLPSMTIPTTITIARST